MAATDERSRHSVSNCCASLARLAPSAERMDSSAARSAVLAIKRFATFVQAISRISTTPAISISEAFFTGPASPSWSEAILGRCLTLSIFPRRETIHLGVKCFAGLRPRDTRFEPRDCVPPIVTPSKRRRFPQNGASRVVEPGRRHPDDGERDSINPNRGTQDSPVAREKVLPEPITDDRDCVVSGCILLGHEPSSQ